MKLYEILQGIALLCWIIGIASVCGAIEWQLDMKYPIAILLFGCGCLYVSIKESGGWHEDF